MSAACVHKSSTHLSQFACRSALLATCYIVVAEHLCTWCRCDDVINKSESLINMLLVYMTHALTSHIIICVYFMCTVYEMNLHNQLIRVHVLYC